MLPGADLGRPDELGGDRYNLNVPGAFGMLSSAISAFKRAYNRAVTRRECRGKQNFTRGYVGKHFEARMDIALQIQMIKSL